MTSAAEIDIDEQSIIQLLQIHLQSRILSLIFVSNCHIGCPMAIGVRPPSEEYPHADHVLASG